MAYRSRRAQHRHQRQRRFLFTTSAASGLIGGTLGLYWLMRYLQPRHSPMILNDAVIVITGASSGLGRAYAEALAKQGARLVLVARRLEKLNAVRQSIAPYAGEVLVIMADVTTSDGRAAVINGTLAHFGQLDALINNAGVYLGGPLDTSDPVDIVDTVDVNLTAVIALTRLALPSMLTRGSGLIINVSSIAGRIPMPGQSVYGATKAGLISFSSALHRELFGTGVDVVSVMPGYVNTEMLTPAVIQWAHEMRLTIIEPAAAAEQTIAGLLRGQSEIYIGGSLYRLSMWGERHLPSLMSLAWRVVYTPHLIDALRSKK